MRRWEMDDLGRERLQLRVVSVPEPGPGEVLVKVAAVSLNHRDELVIESGRSLPLTFPLTPASDMAGAVVALGREVSRFKIGDEVISTFTPGWIDGVRLGNARTPSYRTLGGYYPGVLADYVAFPEDWFVRAPVTLTPLEASTLPCAGLTAWFALIERGHLHAGETVLVEGTGGVALFGIQIAKAHGAEVIISSSAEKLARAKDVGANHCIDRREDDWVETVLRLTGDHGADHILELVGGPHLGNAVQAAAVGGRIYQIGALQGFDVAAPVMPLMLKDVTIHSTATGHRRALQDLVRTVDLTALKPVIDTSYPFDDLSVSLDHLGRGAFGKIVIEI